MSNTTPQRAKKKSFPHVVTNPIFPSGSARKLCLAAMVPGRALCWPRIEFGRRAEGGPGRRGAQLEASLSSGLGGGIIELWTRRPSGRAARPPPNFNPPGPARRRYTARHTDYGPR